MQIFLEIIFIFFLLVCLFITIFVKHNSMSKFKFINILDLVFVCISTFLIVFALIQFFVGSFLLSAFLSVVVTFSILFIFRLTKNKICANKQLKLEEQQNAETYYYNFAFMSKTKQLELIKKFVPQAKNPTIKSSHVEYENKIILFSSTLNEMSKCEFIETIKNSLSTKKEIVVLAYSFSPEVKKIANTLNKKIVLLDKNNFYLFCKNINIKFENKYKNNEKIKIKDIFINFFNKKHAKGFFFSGFILILTSFIIPFKNYYLIYGSILLIFSIICKFKKQEIISEYKF